MDLAKNDKISVHERSLQAQVRLHGWLVTAVVGLIAAITRFIRLDHPNVIVFDETYYVKGAYSLLHYGYERDWEGDDVNEQFVAGDMSGMLEKADRWVHPPLGKWLMAQGMRVDDGSGWGWRFTTALVGVLSAMLIVRVALRMFQSIPIAGLAGLALALDGMGITLSRTGILDGILAFFILAGFWTVLRDREWLALHLTKSRIRPWLILAGIFIGVACGVKWSGAFAGAAFGLLAWIWGTQLHAQAGTRRWFGVGLRDGIRAFFNYVPAMGVTYVLGWLPWLLNPHGWDRQWAAENPNDVPLSWAPDWLNSWLHWHLESSSFHTGLNSEHTYESGALAWILQWRPVSFYWRNNDSLPENSCPSDNCVAAVTSLGNPFIWWMAVIALAIVVYLAFRKDWRAFAVIAGYLGTWAVWFLYPDRTTYQFYAVALLPFVILALCLAVAWLVDDDRKLDSFRVATTSYPDVSLKKMRLGEKRLKPGHRLPLPGYRNLAIGKSGMTLIWTIIGIIVISSLFWMPLWTGVPVPRWFWQMHMWLPSWI